MFLMNLHRWKTKAGWNITMENILEKRKIRVEKTEDDYFEYFM